MRIARIVALTAVSALAGSLLAGPVAASTSTSTTPAIPPPEVTNEFVTLTGPGGRGAAFMDYTDDSTLDLSVQVQGLVPGAKYRLVGSPTECVAADVPGDRLFVSGFKADARGARWLPGRTVTRRSTAPLGSLRLLKGTTGSAQVACGLGLPLTEDDGHPAVSALMVVARFDGPDRRGIVAAQMIAEGALRVTTSLQDVPGSSSLRARGASGACATPLTGATVVLRGPSTDVKPRHTAFSVRDIELEPGAKPGDVDSFRVGPGGGTFTQARCANTQILGLVYI